MNDMRVASRFALLQFVMGMQLAVGADEFPNTCMSPDNENPESVLRYVLDDPVDGSRLDIALCVVPRDGVYPPTPRPNARRPNVFRSYRVLSVTDGDTYRGRETKHIKIEYDYIAKVSEAFPGGKITCKPWIAEVIAYRTSKGWIVSSPADGNELYGLRSVLTADRKRLDEAIAANHMGSVRELSTRIETLSIAADRCPPLKKGVRK